ncbi:recombinase zinc beta ribbon domain-containing protein [Streptococcus urinalis]|uniref:recombinase family protein n=1 Tax=Streptococcus urinalis TaxID=149016 RepID=UPI0009D9B7EF|nr:recombinase family protein [Streptococcus urinalis]
MQLTVTHQQVTKIRVAAYCRVSTDQDEQLSSYENQVNYYRDFISKHEDYELVDIYADEGISATNTKKRDALLQKTYTVDFLTKKRTENDGQVNQFYVANNHEGIIDNEMWETVQLEIARRKAFREEHGIPFYHLQNEDNPFMTKVFCTECGDAFGRKNWTTSRGKRKVWQRNNRYRITGVMGCSNNHIDEEMLEKAFMKAVNILQDHKADVLDKLERLRKGDNLLHKHYAKFMKQLLDIDHFDCTIMCQVLDNITISESGQITVAFLEGTEVDL